MMLSTVQIFAAGSENTESLELVIDGEVVQSWDNIGGNASTGDFDVFSFETASPVTADQVRIQLPSDTYNPTAGIDENLRVDAIEIDGVRYETESSDVFSTGTWKPEDGVVPGFRQDEFLHAAGYFQFADSSVGATTNININAAGSVGTESLALQIDGQTVRTWNNIGTSLRSLSFQASGDVSADQIRVVFLNDLVDPATGADRNLLVENIVVDGETFQTDSPEVFSTGTWSSADTSVTPGFGRGNTLHANGYFQYDDQSSSSTTDIAINASGSDGAESFALQIDGTTVRTYSNIGTNPREFTYQAEGVISIDQVRVVFLNDFSDSAQGIDRNLTVDNVSVGGVTYQTEDPQVFSTGTWSNTDRNIEPGFGRGDTLHSNGFFQYSSEAPLARGTFSLEQGRVTVDEGVGSVTVRVLRTNGSQGVVSLDYTTSTPTGSSSVFADEGLDYVAQSGTLVFEDGETFKDVTIPIIDDSLVEPEERFGFQLNNLVANAELRSDQMIIFVVDNDLVQGTGDGLLGEYFNSTDFTNPVATRVDPEISFNWSLGGPVPEVGVDNFSVRWTGQIEARFTDNYSFSGTVNDGVRLWVNDTLVIDQFVEQSANNFRGEIQLEEGVRYDIRLEYFEGTGTSQIVLLWEGDVQRLEVVPQSQLYSGTA